MTRHFLLIAGLLLTVLPLGRGDEPDDAPPVYRDRANVLFFQDDMGRLEPVKTVADWRRRVTHIRQSMEQVMGKLPEKSSLPLDIKVDRETRLRHYTRQHVTFTVEAGDRLPGWLLVPYGASESDRRPAMICLPGSSSPGKDHPCGLTANHSMAYGHELAERGYVCLILDYPLLHTAEYETDPYPLGYASATMKGIVNHRRGVDLLQSLPFVDPQAIGVIGHSLGGHNALFLAVFDERVKAVASSCGFNVFTKHNKGDVRAWSSRYYMPRIRSVYEDDPAKIPFDFTEVLAALAPRPVFVNAPLHDAPDFEVSGVRDCITAALPVYRQVFQSAEHLEVHYPDAGHDFPAAQRQACYAFLDRHLLKREQTVDLTEGLIAHWPLANHLRKSVSGREWGEAKGNVDPKANGPAVAFRGSGTWLEVPADKAPKLGTDDLSISLWMQSDERADVLSGDLISQYDPQTNRGFHVTLKSSPGVTTNQANWRHLQFGISDGRFANWRDCGRPGESLLAFALAEHEGYLFAGTCEPGAKQSGRVYRYAGGQDWIDCGAPDGSNSVMSLAVYESALYAGTGKYRLAGSSLPESDNRALGGRIFRYAGGTRWQDCGQLPDTEAVGGLVVYRGRLYASSLYRPAGFFRYEGEGRWMRLPVPQGLAADTNLKSDKRVEALAVHEGFLYASSYDGGHIYRFDGTEWLDCGRLGDNTQTYSFAQYAGGLHVGTWPSGRVFRLEKPGQWADRGRLGEELEVMGMVVHNGALIAGTLPKAETYLYDGGTHWKHLAQLDATPDVKYRRAWTMAEHDGEVFCSTLPSGKVFASSMGQQIQWGHSLSSQWHHVVAVKSQNRLSLYLDGEKVAQSPLFETRQYDLTSASPLRIGAGMNGTLNGRLADVRVYHRPLGSRDIEELAAKPPTD